MLKVKNIHTYYGKSHILDDVSFEVRKGTLVSLIGRNGVGKSTAVKSIIGLTPPSEGSITFKDKEITGLPAYHIAKMGLAYVPEDRRIFPELTVFENLMTGMSVKKYTPAERETNIEEVLTYFPSLGPRLNQNGDTLSGGEQQMLAFARALVVDPVLLLLDEPMEGLMPVLVSSLEEVLKSLKAKAKTSILMVEQNTEVVLSVSDNIYIMEKGKIKYEGRSDDLRQNNSVLAKYLGV